MPIVATYLRALRKGLDAAGIPARLLLMQSNGGLTTDAAAAERPMNIIESGPAGGVVGAQALARAKQLDKIITFDMGGTTAKASMVEDGEVDARARVRGRRRHHDRLAAAHRRRLHAEGAGDRSRRGRRRRRLACLDRRRRRAAGRARRARAPRPGPVCYDMGGEMPTITDANVLLGYINPAHLVGGALKLNAEKARAAFAEKIAQPLGMSLERAAYGAHLIAASNMIRAIKAVSTERGRDPREFALFAFGGNGPLFARRHGGGARHRAASWCRRRPGCSRRSGCSTPTSSTTTRARSAACCARPTSARSSAPGTRSREQASDAARGRGLHRRARAAQALGGAALQGPELRADRAGAGRADRCRRWSRISRRRSARSTSGPTAIAPAPRSRSSWWRSSWSAGPARGRGRAASASRRAAPSLAPRRRAQGLFRRRARLARDAGAARAPISRAAPHGPAHRRGIRRDLRGAARRHAPSSMPAGNIVIDA